MVLVKSQITEQSGQSAVEQNTVTGTNALVLTIKDLNTAAPIVDGLLADPVNLSKIGKIEVYGDEHHEEEGGEKDTQAVVVNEENEGSVSRSAFYQATKDNPKLLEVRTARLCEPIIRLLSALSSAPSSDLHTFIWPNPGHNLPRARPLTFWEVLYAHSPTLVHLDIGFVTHELHYAPVPPPRVPFPHLRTLHLDTSGAHGDDGTCIETLLKFSPNLEELHFEWPNCDLQSCQIQNVSWNYDFPNLKRLKIRGWDFAPPALKRFLKRCENVEEFFDGAETTFFANSPTPLDAGTEPDEELDENKSTKNSDSLESDNCELEVGMLPKVKKLYIATDSVRSVAAWFHPDSTRAIQHLRLYHPFTLKRQLCALAEATPLLLAKLKTLEIEGDVTFWRVDGETSEDDDESLDDKTVPKETEKLSSAARALQPLLPSLPNISELGVGLDSTCVSFWDPISRTSKSPLGMSSSELELILRLLPKDTQLRALRLHDEAGSALPQQMLEDMSGIPDHLEYLSWEAKERVLYKIYRDGSKVRAEQCEPLRSTVEGDWTQEKVLSD